MSCENMKNRQFLRKQLERNTERTLNVGKQKDRKTLQR